MNANEDFDKLPDRGPIVPHEELRAGESVSLCWEMKIVTGSVVGHGDEGLWIETPDGCVWQIPPHVDVWRTK